MREALLLVALLSSFTLAAQDWALLNPAYRYNYSNDGSDTISNQLFVTAIDTLAPDTVEFMLNRLARHCQSCGQGCDIEFLIPQFTMGKCAVVDHQWAFSDTSNYTIQSMAALGDQWLFSEEPQAQAVLVEASEEIVLGVLDSVRMLVTALNDSVRWSKSLGIVLWHLHDGPRYQLVGVQGLDLGVQVPTLQEFFRYQPGDVIQFREGSNMNMVTYQSDWRFLVWGRTESADGVTLTGFRSYRSRVEWSAWSYSSEPWTWQVDTATMPELRALHAAPGSLVNLGNDQIGPDASVGMIAEHFRDPEGYYHIESAAQIGFFRVFYMTAAAQAGCATIVIGIGPNGLFLDEELGARSYSLGPPSFWGRSIIGAVIAGDTIGTLYDHYEYDYVGFDELLDDRPRLYPSPASDFVLARDATPGSRLSINDSHGRVVLQQRISSAGERIDVRTLPPGVYVSLLNGISPQRLIIAR